jgi:hypothetical protein
VAVAAGVLAAYGAFAVLISIVAAFANGAHSHQVLSGATWKQLGTGGGIVAGIVLFLSWAAGGFVAARMAGRDGLRHGVWVFVVGVVFFTVVGAAITWLPDTTAILRNLRLLGLPVRRNEWRDVGTVAGIASLVGMAAGAAAGGWYALRERAPVPAARPATAPVPPPPPLPPEPVTRREEEIREPEPVAAPSLFNEPQPQPQPEPEPEPQPAPAPVAEPTPAWRQFIEDRERWATDEPAPTFIEEPEETTRQPAELTSLWPGQDEPETQSAPSVDDAWALPDDETAPVATEGPESAAFPHVPPTPVPEQETEVVVPPLGEHDDWDQDEEPYRAPPQPFDEDVLQHAPEAPAPEDDLEERDERRRQQEDAARAYKQAREDE